MPAHLLRSVRGLAAVIALAAMSSAEPFVQDRFAIGFWVDPPELTRLRYWEIADANFTVALGGYGANSPETIAQQIAFCEEFGLKVMPVTAGLAPAQLPDAPSVWGYLLRDEPNASDFSGLRAQVDELRGVRPGKLAYINLFPNYASPQQLGTATYDEHVRKFVDEVKPDVLSMDHYPQFKPNVDGRDGYCSNLEVMRRESLRAGIPFWNFFNTMPFGPHTDPTEAQLRWQVSASVAYGARGVFYFCYWTPPGGEFPKGGAIMSAEGRPTRHYAEAKRINGALKHLGPTLMMLRSTSVVRVAPATDATNALEGSPLRSIGGADVDPPHDYLIGVFAHADGRRAVFVMNYSVAYAAWPTVEFRAALDDVREVDQATGNEVAVSDDSPAMDGLQLSLDAGAGRLFLVR